MDNYRKLWRRPWELISPTFPPPAPFLASDEAYSIVQGDTASYDNVSSARCLGFTSHCLNHPPFILFSSSHFISRSQCRMKSTSRIARKTLLFQSFAFHYQWRARLSYGWRFRTRNRSPWRPERRMAIDHTWLKSLITDLLMEIAVVWPSKNQFHKRFKDSSRTKNHSQPALMP